MRSGGQSGHSRPVLAFAFVACAVVLVVAVPATFTPMLGGALGALACYGSLRLRPAIIGLVSDRGRAVLSRLRYRPPPGFEGLAVPLLRFSGDGRIIAANAAARAMLGSGAPCGMAHDLFEDMGRPVPEWLRDVATGRHPGGTEVLRLRRRGDGESFVQLTAQPMGAGEVLAVMQDATAMKRLEAQFTQSQKMQAIGQLAGGIAHDFNNLLTAITGHCDLLLLRHRPDDLDHEDLQQIQQNAYRAGALVRQLLAFSRKQTLVPERIELSEVLGEMTHLLKRLLGASVRLELLQASEKVALRADKRQLEQVIMNLAVNARDAMPDGGVLRIVTELVTLDHDMARDRVVVPRGRYALICVRDDGCGIPPEAMEKIFEPFFTTKRAGEGTGLGLSTVYGIVKQSGGYVFVTSTVGKGTGFQLWFPECTETAPRMTDTISPPSPAKLAEGVVLLVEDEAPVRAFAARVLRLRGLTVIEADSGEAALEHCAVAGRIDLILSDMVLPDLDGPSWVRRALENRPGTPVIFMSGYAAEATSQEQLRVANSVFLAKPFTLDELANLAFARMQAQARTQRDDVLSVS